AQILDMSVITGSNHKVAMVGIKTKYLKATLSTANTRRKGYQQTIYLYDRASEENWDGYTIEISKIIREVSKYKANGGQKNFVKWNKTILSISIALNIKIDQWKKQDLSDWQEDLR
ncbi:18670_t:CDS:2, partial [Gigaspora margarita]